MSTASCHKPLFDYPPKNATAKELKKYAALERAERKRKEQEGVSDYQLLAEAIMGVGKPKKEEQ